jgi:hypothetical protein
MLRSIALWQFNLLGGSSELPGILKDAVKRLAAWLICAWPLHAGCSVSRWTLPPTGTPIGNGLRSVIRRKLFRVGRSPGRQTPFR